MIRGLAAAILVLIGIVLISGGAWLIMLGGSAYYAAAGSACLLIAVLVWRGSAISGPPYAALLVATVLWSIAEAGWDPWALVARLFAPAMLGLIWWLPALRPAGLRHAWPAAVATLLVVGSVVLVRPLPGVEPGQTSVASGIGEGEWRHWGGDAGGARYSTLADLNPATVARLAPAWTYRTGVPPDGRLGNLEVTPLMAGGRLFVCNNMSMVDALDPETGRRLWRFDPQVDVSAVSSRVCRGVAYARVPGAPCPERIIATTLDARLLALDAATGTPCPGFGDGGAVDLMRGMGKVDPGGYYPTSAPTIVSGNIVVGGWVTDGQRTGSAPGVVRAFDLRTGAFAWSWDIARPGVSGEPPPGGSYTAGTPNVWAPMSADDRLGLVYLPTGNATPDYWGGHRGAEAERFASSVVALDARTGRVRWSFQTVHHDLWDYDVSAQPTLLDLDLPGGRTPALLQVTKQGQLFLLDRRNGRPLSPVAERPVPQGGAPGERLAPAQPSSTRLPHFAGPVLTEARMWGLTPLDQLWCRIRFYQARYDGPFTPPGLRPTVQQPGFMGAISWGGVSVDPRRGIAFVNATRLPTWHRLVPRAEADRLGLRPRGTPGARPVPGYWPQAGVPYAIEARGFLSPLGIPCAQPPYGVLAAVDLARGRLMWEQPLGDARGSGPFGLRLGLPLPMGVPNTGGSIATAGGVVFIAATQDEQIRAIEAATGRVLWSAQLPAGGQATPMTYRSPTSGRQFVVVAAGGKALLKTRLGDHLVAFALPEVSDAR